MATQTERRKSTIFRNRRPGIDKNSGSLGHRAILETASPKSVAFGRSMNLRWKRDRSALAPQNPGPGGPCARFPAADEAETPSKGFGKPDGELRHGLQCVASLDTSCLIWPLNIPQQGVSGLHRRVAKVRADRPPFEEFTASQMQRILRTTYRITRNREDAEDAMQDACLQAFVHFQDFDGRSKFGTWLTKIAINSALMTLRKRKTGRIVSLDSARNSEESNAFQELRDPTLDAEQRYLQTERETTLCDAIKELRAPLRAVVEAAQLGERSMRETAEIVGVSLAATKARLFHARAALRKSRKLRSFATAIT